LGSPPLSTPQPSEKDLTVKIVMQQVKQ